MSREDFLVWAAPGNPWSPWVKPAPFIGEAPSDTGGTGQGELVVELEAAPDLCAVVDLDGPKAVRAGLLLARAGFRPVPLINTSSGRHECVPMQEVLAELRLGAKALRSSIVLPVAAPPAFILDARRLSPGFAPFPAHYDNRWLTFPQDFPSARFLTEQGIRRCVVITSAQEFAEDLSHVLARFQDAGLVVYRLVPGPGAVPHEVRVTEPPRYKRVWYRFLVALGLKRNQAGGFGAWVPEARSHGYG